MTGSAPTAESRSKLDSERPGVPDAQRETMRTGRNTLYETAGKRAHTHTNRTPQEGFYQMKPGV